MHSEPASSTPANRIRVLNDHEVKDGRFVLYWMTAFRRSRSNFALQHAAEKSVELGKPLVILDALRLRYKWNCDRFHQFIIDGMISNHSSFRDANVFYYPFVETCHGDGSGLLHALSLEASLVVADDFPCFFHPVMYRRVAVHLPVRIELVDSNCVMPLSALERTFTVAHSYRRAMQKTLPEFLSAFPREQPVQELDLPKPVKPSEAILKRWPVTDLKQFEDRGTRVSQLPIGHSVRVTDEIGGESQAQALFATFLDSRLEAYDHDRNVPDKRGSSQLSPYFHFGHLSPHDVFSNLMEQSNWSIDQLAKPNGKMNGFWNVDVSTEAFLDQLLTWREIGYNMCWRESNYDQFESLPEWAQVTLAEHAEDPREHSYSLEEFEQAATHDPLWNAAQQQLVHEGRIHNYMRMLWGKKILHWTESPRQALRILIELNNKYALDGRNPNSYSGIFWTLGRYDRAWGPERQIFGKVRYMTSESTAKKWPVKSYMRKFSRSEN